MPARTKALPGFSEAEAWKSVGDGWKRLFGSFKDLGFTFEWHQFESGESLDWGKSFHPQSLEICLNLAGTGKVIDVTGPVEFSTLTSGFYFTGSEPLPAERNQGEKHQFITLELSMGFLHRELRAHAQALHPIPRALLEGRQPSHFASQPSRLTAAQQEVIRRLRNPPVALAAQALWYQARALDLVVDLLFQPAAESNLFCTRQKQLSRDRVAQVVAILKRNLAEPPSLEELARQVGCSPFYLSRTFTQEMGGTMSQHLRSLRMEKAAELLRTGQYNVTEAAMDVGYSSLSHFSVAFHETFGCCPGLYPLGARSRK